MKIILRKRILALFLVPVLILTITFCDVKKTHAVVGTILTGVGVLVALEIYANSNPDYQYWYDNWYRPKFVEGTEEALKSIGLPTMIARIPGGLLSNPVQELRLWKEAREGSSENYTDDDLKQIAFNMYKNSTHNYDNDTFTMSNDLRDFTLYLSEKVQDIAAMYVGYSLDLRYYDNGYRTSFIQNEIIPNQDSYLYFILNWNGNDTHSRCLKVDKSKFIYCYI